MYGAEKAVGGTIYMTENFILEMKRLIPQTVQIRKVNVIRKLWRVSKHIENESPVHLAFYCDILILSQIAFVQLFSE